MSAPRGYPGKASFYPGDRSRASDVAERRRRKWLMEGVLEIDPADVEDDKVRGMRNLENAEEQNND